MIYTGVGSRETPSDILRVIEKLAANFGKKGHTLRSGGAEGADSSFELGCRSVAGSMEIYLPWYKFNGNRSPLFTITEEAYKIASRIHPCWEACTPAARKLHARNCYQVLGRNLNQPSDLLICWTKNGQSVGGTRTAIELAKEHKIPIVNLANKETVQWIIKEFL